MHTRVWAPQMCCCISPEYTTKLILQTCPNTRSMWGVAPWCIFSWSVCWRTDSFVVASYVWKPQVGGFSRVCVQVFQAPLYTCWKSSALVVCTQILMKTAREMTCIMSCLASSTSPEPCADYDDAKFCVCVLNIEPFTHLHYPAQHVSDVCICKHLQCSCMCCATFRLIYFSRLPFKILCVCKACNSYIRPKNTFDSLFLHHRLPKHTTTRGLLFYLKFWFVGENHNAGHMCCRRISCLDTHTCWLA